MMLVDWMERIQLNDDKNQIEAAMHQIFLLLLLPWHKDIVYT